MAFGDSDNDLEMLSGVSLSFMGGMETSSVKEVITHDNSNSKDGIHKALEHLVSSEEKGLYQQ